MEAIFVHYFDCQSGELLNNLVRSASKNWSYITVVHMIKNAATALSVKACLLRGCLKLRQPTTKTLEGEELMRRRYGLYINSQCRDAAIFIFLCILLIWGLIVLQENMIATSNNQTSIEYSRSEYESIPIEVIREASSCANREWEYVRRAFPERSYCEYKLDAVHHVLTCHHVVGEAFEVYGITCSYRRDDCEDWELPENVANSFLVFRVGIGGSIKWIGDISTYYEPGTEEFETDVHTVLMKADEQYLFKLLADNSLEKTLERTLFQYLRNLIPGDYYCFGWKQLAQETAGNGGQVYGVLLYHTTSSSPLIYSEKTEQYVPAIHSTCLLPIRATYQKDKAGQYAVTELWVPSEDHYEPDIREIFPAETAALVLENLNQYAVDLLLEFGAAEGDEVFTFFSRGPAWPAYSFDEALDDTTLCGLAEYYRDGDIYCEPVREEVIQRFCADPAGLLNGLGAGSEDTIESVCRIIVEAGIDIDFDSIDRNNLSPEGQISYETLEKDLENAGVAEK